jgi:ABC-type phosphate transport system auxiliary subunit
MNRYLEDIQNQIARIEEEIERLLLKKMRLENNLQLRLVGQEHVDPHEEFLGSC